MKLEDLKKMGAFVPDTLVEKEIRFTLAGGTEELTATVRIRRLSIGAQEDLALHVEPNKPSRIARIISDAVRFGDEGEEKMTYAQAYTLDPNLARAISVAFREVNGRVDLKN